MTDSSSLHDHELPATDELPWEAHEHVEEGDEEPYLEETEEESQPSARDRKPLARTIGIVALIAVLGGGGYYAFSAGLVDLSGVTSLWPFGGPKNAVETTSPPSARSTAQGHGAKSNPEQASAAATPPIRHKRIPKIQPKAAAVALSPAAVASAASDAPVQLAPGTPSVAHNREFDHWRIQGLTFMYEQKPIEAMAAFKKALSLKPGDRSALAALNSLQKALDAGAEQIEGQVAGPKPKVSLPIAKKSPSPALLKLPALRLELPAVLTPPASQSETKPSAIPGKTP
jgi:hypothetical protein